MSNYFSIVKQEDSVSGVFNIEEDKVFHIGHKINRINEEEYMNGYNREELLNYYLEEKCANLLDEMDGDSEASTYVAYYPLIKEKIEKSKYVMSLITEFIENEETLYEFIIENNNEIVCY
ncbi:Imm51 family immunity protein [Oceanirhabdus sp. W0125-5]|uniref:Imm51 family immunity protein n=1 Tax=Oceanirhabdus sp. W0125-5 TaxID=2999116 RepID=UPI0022F339FD|nr:Imm51 family immunity protein [Oceanirhabdus sp. W0125-5]WBW95225.1 Imm51 family immunity protein [Oceanirhabdus sp. W0125-5]